MKGTRELNILCIGELMAGKSTFLQHYTFSDHSQQHYKIFARKQKQIQKVEAIYLHEIEEKVGIDVYLKQGFDGILFFVRMNDFHNTSRSILESISLYSQISGNNVYKIPVKIVVISSKCGRTYNDISYGQKRNLMKEVSTIFNEEQIIYVESDENYKNELTKFYKQILAQEAKGVKQCTYTNWKTRDIANFFGFSQIQLQIHKFMEEVQICFGEKWKFWWRYGWKKNGKGKVSNQ